MIRIKISDLLFICSVILLSSTVNGDRCNPSPCAANTNCKVSARGVPICFCKDKIGDPLGEGCKRECETNYDCEGSKKCSDYKCVECVEHSDCFDSRKSTCFSHSCTDICKEVQCGIGALCTTTPDHQALCYCPPGSGSKGRPFTEC